jgi:hypothetical protein
MTSPNTSGNTVAFTQNTITFSHDTIIADIHRELSAQAELIATIVKQDSHFTSLVSSDSSSFSRHHFDRFKAKLAHLCQLVSPVLYYLVQYELEIGSSYEDFVFMVHEIQSRVNQAVNKGEECIAGYHDVFDTNIISIGANMHYRYMYWLEAQKTLVKTMVGTLCLSRFLYSSAGYRQGVNFSTCAGILRYLRDN